ncbi:hypothetical protein [Helicobacter equorum]|uniref:hypothetical protein n=1 Tax=Helicobacter equorum TaxID=361872 RepID=UPI000CF01647|nr:hypothetical protein [Helicobacter equorum]
MPTPPQTSQVSNTDTQPSNPQQSYLANTLIHVSNGINQGLNLYANDEKTKQYQEMQKSKQEAMRAKIHKPKEMTIHNEMDKHLSQTTPDTKEQNIQIQPTLDQDVKGTQGAITQKGHNPFFVFRNTGIDYFDKKKEITLADALIARELGVNLSKVYMENKMDVDFKQRKIEGSEPAKHLRGLADVAGYIRDFAENIDKGEGVINYLARGINKLSGGFVGINDTNQKIMAGEKILGSQIVDLLYGSRSTEAERKRIYDLAEFKSRSKKQIKANLKELLGLLRTKYKQALIDFTNRGFLVSDDIIQNYHDIDKIFERLN